MKKYLQIIFILTVSALAPGCTEEKFNAAFLPGGGERPLVLLNYPTEGTTGIDVTQNLWVVFSNSMDKEKTQSAFKISSGKGEISGTFRWEGDKMIFTPSEPISENGEYVMIVGRDAENLSGVDLGEDFIVHFYARQDQISPLFLSSKPAHGATNVSGDNQIELMFSEEINFSTVDDGISISPSILATRTLNSSKNGVIIAPTSPLAGGGIYNQYQQWLKGCKW